MKRSSHVSRSLVIPSAGFATRLYPLSQDVPKALVELNGVPFLHLFYKQAVTLGVDNLIVIVNPEFERRCRDFVKVVYPNAYIPIHVVAVRDPEAGPLYSICEGLRSPVCRDDVLVILSDTLYTGRIPEANDCIFYQEVEGDLKRWCLVETDFRGKIKKFWDKPQGDCPTNKALIGIYSFNRELFLQCSDSVFSDDEKVRGEFQISQALEKYMEKEDLYTVETEQGAWHDTGTLETLRESSLNIFISRQFNHISLSPSGVLRKASSDKSVLASEYKWYTSQRDNKDILPAIYCYSEDVNNAYIDMELCSLADLGTIFNFCNAEPKFFEQTIQYLLNLLNKKFYSKKTEGDYQANEKMLLTKLNTRLEKTSYSIPEEYKDFFLKDLNDICRDTSKFSVIHGDLCIANILFEPQRMIIKLIDPRGEYGNTGIFGDIRYDLAKLMHSLDGKYETIINQLYRVENDEVVYFMGEEKKACFKRGEEVLVSFAESIGINPRDIYVIEANFFLSMLPLHSDDRMRQKAFYLTALEILRKLYNEEGNN